MNWTDKLTPKDTEEIKPGLFIQKTSYGYRKITPAAWDGKINWKVFLLGADPIKSFLVFAIILLISYGYYTSTKACDDFQADPCKYLSNITDYCVKFSENPGQQNIVGYFNFEVNNDKRSDPHTIQSNP